MAKREKEGNGAKVAVRSDEQHLPARRTEQTGMPALRMQHPMRWLREEIDDLFDRFFGRWPSVWEPSGALERFWDVDVEETEQEIVVRTEAPGFEPKDFDIHLSGNTLTIQAEHKEEAELKEAGYRRWERRFGQFQRMIPLSWKCVCRGRSPCRGSALRSKHEKLFSQPLVAWRAAFERSSEKPGRQRPGRTSISYTEVARDPHSQNPVSHGLLLLL